MFTLKISDCYKGCTTPGSTIEMRQLGGTYGGVPHLFPQGVSFKVNKSYILFLATFPNSPSDLLNPDQAAYDGEAGADGNFANANSSGTWTLSPAQIKQLFGK